MDLYSDPKNNRNRLPDHIAVGQLGGISIQTEFAKQDLTEKGGSPGRNRGDHAIYVNSKYIWIIGTTLAIFDGDTGEGISVIDPWSISYTVSRWCSTIPQPGTPADLLDSYQYQ